MLENLLYTLLDVTQVKNDFLKMFFDDILRYIVRCSNSRLYARLGLIQHIGENWNPEQYIVKYHQKTFFKNRFSLWPHQGEYREGFPTFEKNVAPRG